MKKVMIALLAMAVLFGFAACDNSTGNVTSDQLRVLGTLTNETEYLPGEAVDAADFSFTAYTVDGTAKTIDASEVKKVSGEEYADSSKAEYVFTWNGVRFSGAITVNTVTGITVDASASNVKKDYYATDWDTTHASDGKKGDFTDDLITLAGVKLEVAYTDSTGTAQKRTVDATSLHGVTAAIANWNPSLSGGTASADVTVTYAANKTDTYPVTLSKNYVDSVALVEVNEDATYYVGGSYDKET